MLRALALVMTTLGALASGCGTGDLPPPPPPGTLKMTLGGSDVAGHWITLTDGQDAELEPGAQGGFHVWMKMRIGGMEPSSQPSRLVVRRSASRVGDGKLVLRSPATVIDVLPDGGGSWEQPMPMPMFMCPSPIGLSVIDQPIAFRVELLHRDEATSFETPVAGGEVRLVPRCPAAYLDFCQKICTG